MPSPKLALVCLYATSIIMGVNGVFSKVIPLNAVTITELRSVIAASALAIFILAQRQSFRLKSKRHYAVVVGLGALMAIHWSSFFHAMQASTVAIGVLAHYSYPVIIVIAEPLLDKRSPALGDVLAGIAVLAGVGLMVTNWDINSDVFMGVIFGLISAVSFGTRNILQRRWLQSSSSSGVMFYQLLTVAVLTAPFMDIEAVLTMPPINWQLLLLLGVVSTALTHTLIALSLRALSAKTVSIVSCVQPPAAICLTWLIIGEVPSFNTIVGGGIILTTALYESVKQAGRVQ